jgi:hypothetical protein
MKPRVLNITLLAAMPVLFASYWANAVSIAAGSLRNESRVSKFAAHFKKKIA